jgi:hypothetical protein
MSAATLVMLSRESDPSSKRTSKVLRVNQPGDSFEQEADRVANTVSAGGRIPGWSLASTGADRIQRDSNTASALPAAQPIRQIGDPQDPPAPSNYGDMLAKLAEAFLQTSAGKTIVKYLTDQPIVQDAKDFVETPQGVVVAGTTAVAAITGLAAAHQGLPIQIPAIPLDKLHPGLKMKIDVEGPLDHPTQGSLMFSFEGAPPKKKKGAVTDKERFQAETERVAEDQRKFRAGMAPHSQGPLASPEAQQQQADEQLARKAELRRLSNILQPGATHKPGEFNPLVPGTQPQSLHMRDPDLIPSPDATKKEKKEEIPVQRKAETAYYNEQEAAPEVESVISSSGRPLDRETRHYMESRIVFDFSKVRIHTDSRAAASAKSLNARAYTVGNNIVFGAGRYSPQTAEGRKLIAHELTHTVQQQRHVPAPPSPIRAKTAQKARKIPLREAAANLRREQDKRAATILAKGPVQFRVPTTADLKALFTSGTVPEDVLKDRIQLALTRIKVDPGVGRDPTEKKKTLKTTDSIAEIMKKVFPAPHVFDEAAYEAAVDVTDRTEVYQSVADAEARVTSADKPRLKTIMGDAAKLIDECAADDSDLQSVFGTRKNVAKAVYVKAKAALNKASANVDTKITTDYNLDDPETGLGGWARFSDQQVHFRANVVKATDEALAKIIIIHEACHLADPTVKDDVYYGRPGFEHKTEDEKVKNAAHYEEIPARKLGKSKYQRSDGSFIDFTPAASGAKGLEERVKEKAVAYFRKAWDKAADVHKFIRDIRGDELKGNTASFHAKEPRIREISRLMHLTVHEQPPATAAVNQVDVVLAEGVVRAMNRIQGTVMSQTVPDPFALKMPPLKLPPLSGQPSVLNQKLELQPVPGLGTPPVIQTDDELANKVIEDSIKTLGTTLAGKLDEDKALVDWLVAEYQKPF